MKFSLRFKVFFFLLFLFVGIRNYILSRFLSTGTENDSSKENGAENPEPYMAKRDIVLSIQKHRSNQPEKSALTSIRTSDYSPTHVYPVTLLPVTFTLHDPDDERTYFTKRMDGFSCFTAGTLLNESVAFNSTCKCRQGFYGTDCGIPESVWETACPFLPGKCSELKVREKPRRLIHGINVNHELEFFEMRLEEIGDVVDVFIVGESNITAGGNPSQLYLLPQLRQGFMSHFQHKILHVFIDHFPEEGYTDGWFADTFIRNYMGQAGLKRIKNVRDDDLFLLLDADEIPNRDVLLFLKLYDGYPEPIALTLRWSVYGFFWKRAGRGNQEDVTRVVAISTMAMINQVYDGQVMSLRRNELQQEPFSRRISQYVKDDEKRVAEWTIGSTEFYAGFHCSWCYRPEGIRLKLMAAQKDDKPRWGDYPDKLDLTYITGLIENGVWFDGSKPFFLVSPQSDGDKNYAPKYVWRNKKRFDYLLNHSHSYTYVFKHFIYVLLLFTFKIVCLKAYLLCKERLSV